MTDGDLRRETRCGTATLLSRSSLRASSARIALKDADPEEPNARERSPRRTQTFTKGPRILQRAALQVASPEELLRACLAAELVAQDLNFTSRGVADVSHVVMELGQNLLRHADGGTITLAQVTGTLVALEIFAQDRGPGVSNVSQLLSTPPPADCKRGLYGVSRLVDEFDIHTGTNGTHVRAVVYA